MASPPVLPTRDNSDLGQWTLSAVGWHFLTARFPDVLTTVDFELPGGSSDSELSELPSLRSPIVYTM